MNGYDIAYAVGLGAAAPYWLLKTSARRKVFRALNTRMGRDIAARTDDGPAIMMHAVSLGEINATRAMVRSMAEIRPDLQFIISTTTETGAQRGQELYGSDPRVTLIRYPLDFTRSINRVLDNLRPGVVVLMELEVWPNFMRQCRRRDIPVVLVNGRLTAGSFRNYRLGGALVRRMFARLAAVCAQEQSYADRFIALGAAPDRVQVTGTMKFDTAEIGDSVSGANELASDLGLHQDEELIWVCGSTGPGEEIILLRLYRGILKSHPRLRLVLVPRKPERFDEVAGLIRDHGFELIRRSRPSRSPSAGASPADAPISQPVILGDTMGELRKFYSLADVVFVGRTLVDLGSRQHGSDMIEPAALAKPLIVGSFTGNFAAVMSCFREADAVREVHNGQELAQQVELLLNDHQSAQAMGRRAQDVVRRQQGATARNVSIILAQLEQNLELKMNLGLLKRTNHAV
jgi:3-deoxy-D-manno-octulosonic-acid transferase